MKKQNIGKLLAILAVIGAAIAAMVAFFMKFSEECDCCEDDWDDEFDEDYDDFEVPAERGYVSITPVAPEHVVSEDDGITTMEEAMEAEVREESEE